MQNIRISLLACYALVLVTAFASQSLAKSIIWVDDFVQNENSTLEQCQAWHDFLDQLSPDNDFVTVTMRGTFDSEGITMTDPAAIQELANLLYTRTAGSVISEGHTWYVYIGCNLDSCVPGGQGVELGVDNGGGCQCPASEGYTVRPDIGNSNWGGINALSCRSESQTMMVEFSSTSDSDEDGIADDLDHCSLSNLSQTVVYNECDSGIDNTMFSDGCSINDYIDRCADDAMNHGQFVSCVSGQLNGLKKEGLISGKEKGAVQKCVATGKYR